MRPNPLAQAERQRQATRARPEVRGTFSQSGPWRPAAVARLARTLGRRGQALWRSSRISALRRGLNSHEAAKPRTANNPQRPRPRQTVESGFTFQHRVGFIQQSRPVGINSAAKSHKDMEAPRQLATPSRFGGNKFHSARWAAIHSAAPFAIGLQLRQLQFAAHHDPQRGAASICSGTRGATMPY